MVEVQQEVKCKTQAISEGVLIFNEVKACSGAVEMMNLL